MKNRILAAALLLATMSFGQSATEQQLWLKASHKMDLAKGKDLVLSAQFRTPTLTDVSSLVVEGEYRKKASKNLTYSFEGRHYTFFDNRGATTGIDQRVRFALKGERTYEVPGGDLSMRYAFQQRFILTGGGSNKSVVRVRTQKEVKIKNFGWDPTFAVEGFRTLGGDNDVSFRFGVESGNKLAGQKIGLGYFYERNISNTGPHVHVLQTSIRW
jgi:hypothetical protein